MQKLESALVKFFVDKSPLTIPLEAKTLVVKFIPYLALLAMILSALSAVGLAQIALLKAGQAPLPALVVLWLCLLVVVIEVALYAMAFMPLKNRSKKGWNNMYWVTLLGAVYALLYVLLDRSVWSLVFSLLSTLIGLYLLFQIRDQYITKKTTIKSSKSKKP